MILTVPSSLLPPFRITTAIQTIATSLMPLRTATIKAIDVKAATPTAEGSTAPMETAGSSLTTEIALEHRLSLLVAAMVPMRQLVDIRSLQVTLEETHEAGEQKSMVSLAAGDQMPPEEEVIDLILKVVGTTTMEINPAEAVRTTKTRCLISSTKRPFAVISRNSRPVAWETRAPSLMERLRKEA